MKQLSACLLLCLAGCETGAPGAAGGDGAVVTAPEASNTSSPEQELATTKDDIAKESSGQTAGAGANRQEANGGGENKPSAPGISIHEAAEKGDLEAIKKHIAAASNINAKDDDDGETPLHRAITRRQTEAVKLLIDKGCDINIGRTKDGDTPLDMAENRGLTEIAKLLREKGAKKSSN